MNQLISSAVGEKLSALMTAEHLEERAGRGNRRAYEAVLRKVSSAPPEAGDELPRKSSLPRTRGRRPTRARPRR